LRALSSLFRGYVIIRARGGRLEALVNRAVAQGIGLWQLERAGPELLVARVHAGDFPALARAARGLGVDVSILRKEGLPFVLIRAGRRQAFVAGGALFAALLYVLAQFVWFVQVDGAGTVPADEILAVAAEAGLRPGVLRERVQRDVVERRLHLAIPRLAWVAVDVRGAAATVRVVERTVLGDDVRRPGHIVASRDGVVERIALVRGEALVAPGETVREGQPLISGMLPPGSAEYEERVAQGELPYVRAAGTVQGRTWYRGLAEAALAHSSETETGRVHRQLVISVGERRVEMGSPEPPFADARWELWEWSPGWFPGLAVTWRVAREVRRTQAPPDPVAAREEALAQARTQALAQLPPAAEVLDEQVSVWDDTAAGVVRAAVTIEVRQELGRFEPIGGPAGGPG